MELSLSYETLDTSSQLLQPELHHTFNICCATDIMQLPQVCSLTRLFTTNADSMHTPARYCTSNDYSCGPDAMYTKAWNCQWTLLRTQEQL